MLPAVPRRAISVDGVIGCVAESYGISVKRLMSGDRHKTVCEARGVTCWLLRTINGLSYPELGRAMSGRDHTTMMSAVRKVLRRRETEQWFAAFTDQLATAVAWKLEIELPESRTNASAATHQGTGSLSRSAGQVVEESCGSATLALCSGSEAKRRQPRAGRETESESSSVSLDVGKQPSGAEDVVVSPEGPETTYLVARLRDRVCADRCQANSIVLDARQTEQDEWCTR
jgi:hypothetical protein